MESARKGEEEDALLVERQMERGGSFPR